MTSKSFKATDASRRESVPSSAIQEIWYGGGSSISELASDEDESKCGTGDSENETSSLLRIRDDVDTDDDFDRAFETLQEDIIDNRLSAKNDDLLFRHSYDDGNDDLLGTEGETELIYGKGSRRSNKKKLPQLRFKTADNTPSSDKKRNHRKFPDIGENFQKIRHAVVIPTAVPLSNGNENKSTRMKSYGTNVVEDAEPLLLEHRSGYQGFCDLEGGGDSRLLRRNSLYDFEDEDDYIIICMGQSCSCSSCFVGSFLAITVIFLLVNSIMFASVGNGRNSTGKPNFVFILSDDVGYGILEKSTSSSSSDHRVNRNKLSSSLFEYAPFLRKLKEEKGAIYFDNYYSQEICTPARAALLTGKYPISLGIQGQEIIPNSRGGLDLNETGLLSQLLQDYGGYTTYMLGKWNLGHSQPDYLPTARGFDYFIGYLSTATTYWKKCLTSNTSITDFMYSQSSRMTSWETNERDQGFYKKYSHSTYEGTYSQNTYSTFLYRNMAIDWISTHDYSKTPMFLYLAFQGSHRPYTDVDQYTTGIPKSYTKPSSLYDSVLDYTEGLERQQYTLSVLVMDQAIQSIVEALQEVGQLHNTYIIYASDNGGCTNAGAYNSDLRGSKGSLFEGGTKVDALLYSTLLESAINPFSFEAVSHDYIYGPLMHVTDWVPTIIDLAGLTDNIPSQIRESWDGYSHVSEISRMAKHGVTSSMPRNYMLYNYYDQISHDGDDDDDSNGSVNDFIDALKAKQIGFAIRNNRYKLMHAYVNNAVADWCNDYSEINASIDDDDITDYETTSCTLDLAQDGTFVYLLFDLYSDPSESINLYDESEYSSILTSLYTQLYDYHVNKVKPATIISSDNEAIDFFATNYHYVQPWQILDNDDLIADM